MTLFDIAYDDFKREDTTNTIVITLYTDDKQPITPDSSHTWKAKVSKGDKYVGEYPVTISGNTIKLSSSNLTRLPNGDYGLELWETYSGSTTIYPSAGVMEFRVHRNANDTLGTVDPTTDINGIIDDLHKAGQNIKVVATNTLPPGSKASVTQSITNGENQLTFNIPQGDKGEKGNVGPAPTLKIGTVTKLNPDQMPTASLSGGNGSYTLDLGIPQGVQGETNPTATQALDTANSVNSKVNDITSNGGGTNLLTGTSDFTGWTVSDIIPGGNANGLFFAHLYGNASAVAPNLTLAESTTYTVSFDALGYDAGRTDIYIGYSENSRGDILASDHVNVALNALNGASVRVSITFTTSSSFTKTNFNIGCGAGFSTGGSIYIRHVMLEKGTVAHDWQPAPEDAPSNDSQLVHKTNNETIAGDKTFVGNTTLATTTILEGNYGLRVTSSGIQKTTDGKTWVPANI